MVRRKGIGDFGRGLINESLAGLTETPAVTESPVPAPTLPAPSFTGPSTPYSGPQASHSTVGKRYRRHEVSDADEEGFVWMRPSPTAWPDVLPDGHNGRPPTPRTYTVGYRPGPTPGTGTIRAVFQRPTKSNPSGEWHYDGVSAKEWESLRRTPSTGRYMNKVLNHKSHGRGFYDSLGSDADDSQEDEDD